MTIFGRFFKSDSDIPTRNSVVLNALKILRDGSLTYDERAGALTKLKSIFFTSVNKDDLRAISQSILKTASTDGSVRIREVSLSCFETIVEGGTQSKISIVSGYVEPLLIKIAEDKNEDSKELRQKAFGILLKIAPAAITDEFLRFLTRGLNEKNDGMGAAVISAFESLIRSADDLLKKRIAKFCSPALCKALDDPAVWMRCAAVLGSLGKYALGAAPFLYERLDDKEGECAAAALRNITGENYGREEKQKWEKWLKKSVVK